MPTTLSGVTVSPFAADDTDAVAASTEIINAVRAVDSPWLTPDTVREHQGRLRHGWDGEPDSPYLAVVDGEPVATGSISTSEHDNLHLAWVDVDVRPDRRRQGLGSQVLATLLAEAGARGRTSVGIGGWDSAATLGFAAHHGFEQKSVGVQRRQTLADVDWDVVERLHAGAQESASAYQVVRRTGSTPDAELDELVTLVSAINDAPTDDLDIEDEVFTPERVRAYETSQAARGLTLHRVLVRHRETGDPAGHTVVVVDPERPTEGDQHDTSVVAAHRGHRLGLLLKTEMNLWLREIEPQLETVDTWNAESNRFMIGVNEQLGYRVTGRALNFQRAL